MARATVYHQFGSKLGLLDSVARDFERRAGLDRLTDVIKSTPPGQLVQRVVIAGCDYWATDPQLARKINAVAVADTDAAQLLAEHDAGRLDWRC